MPFGETKADQTVALPHDEATRCETPYPEPDIAFDPDLLLWTLAGYLLFLLACIGVGCLWAYARAS